MDRRASNSPGYDSLKSEVLSVSPPLLQPGKSTRPDLTAEISALQLHPTIEASLHLLNSDLPSAHFLVRHMQSAPAYEGMLLHGILHRIEGDIDNARAWYRDVWANGSKTDPKDVGSGEGSRLLEAVWDVEEEEIDGEKAPWMEFVERVELLKNGESVGEEREHMGKTSRQEIVRVLESCEKKFGRGTWLDASQAYVRPGGKTKETGNDMVTGDKGFRKF